MTEEKKETTNVEETKAVAVETKGKRRKGRRKKKAVEVAENFYRVNMSGIEQEILDIQEKFIKKDVPFFKPGDNVKVHIKIPERKVVKGKVKETTRIQIFEGFVLRKNGGQLDETFTVRKMSYHGVGVEKIFPLHSPIIDRIEIVKKNKVRRARLYYMRDRIGKKATM